MRSPTTLLGAACVMAGLLSVSGCDDSSTTRGPAGTVTRREPEQLAELGQVPAFSLTNERGKSWGSRELAGKPYVAAFMFTRCPTVCPRLTKKMVQVKQALHAADSQVQMVSISVDPEYDTPVALAAYKKKYGATFDDWHFLTGDYQVIAKTAEEGFKVALSGTADEKKQHYGITHGSHLILVDARGKIRGYFRSTDEDVATQLVQATAKL